MTGFIYMVTLTMMNVFDIASVQCCSKTYFFRMHWNTHSVHRSRYDIIAGKPGELFFLSESLGCEDQLQPVTDVQLEVVASHCIEPILDSIYQTYFNYVVDLQQLSTPQNWKEGLNLFKHLLVFTTSLLLKLII